MKPKMHSFEVMVETNSSDKMYTYWKGKRVPVQVIPVKLAQGTLYLEYFFFQPKNVFGGDVGFLYFNPTGQYKTNLYPDTVLEFSLGSTTPTEN